MGGTLAPGIASAASAESINTMRTAAQARTRLAIAASLRSDICTTCFSELICSSVELSASANWGKEVKVVMRSQSTDDYRDKQVFTCNFFNYLF